MRRIVDSADFSLQAREALSLVFDALELAAIAAFVVAIGLVALAFGGQ